MATKSTESSARTSRTAMSRERVLAAAVALADAAGLEALTMRRLARDLELEAMSLYHYVSGKDDLVAGMVDIVVGEIQLPADGTDWKTALRDSAISAHDVLSRHPWVTGVMMTARARTSRLRYMDAILGRLRGAGFSAEMTHHAYHALDSHIVGFTLWAASSDELPDDLTDLAAAFVAEVGPDAYPFLIEHVRQHLVPRGADDKGEFAFGLDLILDGLDQTLE